MQPRPGEIKHAGHVLQKAGKTKSDVALVWGSHAHARQQATPAKEDLLVERRIVALIKWSQLKRTHTEFSPASNYHR